MKEKEREKFRKILQERRAHLLAQVADTKEQGMGVDAADLPDEVDLASSEWDQSMNLRLRDRETSLLKKIERALEKLEKNVYGACEECGEEIGLKRLEARPVTELCIRCKEQQEKLERGYAD